jgi:uncharacterized protein YdaU (DUF1376 family)
MSKLPSMPFFVDAYLADTTHLTLEEHGAYLLLLMAMWRRAGAIAEADAARVLGLHARAWLRLKPRLMPMLISYQSEGVEMLSQKKLQIEWNYSVENRRRQSEKGRAGFEARKRNQIERNQILGSSPGLSPSRSRGSTEIDASISNKKEKRKETVSTGLDTAEDAPAQNGADPHANRRADLTSLLKTPLMQRSGR